ncbi:type III PLP-dependent enzyme domain-containing protein [Phaeocystidibacter luteus]|uniref:Arginine decarboxylase n=1 Tax=Phaeocystidibacter luteus TaxID=911197 RepID=A0A6N6RCN7_9FLAO|nr:arginine decarboxylase [Phaeocystidibacter luteus]KAB2805395.1 arginine decarboxylase [Phaeocystidibacter luteus]
MKNKYSDLIEQTFYWPQEEFYVEEDQLMWHDINLMDVIKQYGTPLKVTYLPKISENIQKAKRMFNVAMAKVDYKAEYNYCYCTKSSHFSFILDEALKNDIHIETSSAFDINIIEELAEQGKLTKKNYVVCNGYKRDQYLDNIARLINNGWTNVIPVMDNKREVTELSDRLNEKTSIGVRIASEEEPKFEFYTSRLGIGYKDIVPFYENHIANNDKVELKMLHFFINTGINDTAYYWNELLKCVNVYISLKKICPTLDSLNIGGGFPIKNSLNFDYDYAYMAEEIIAQVKRTCEQAGIQEPHIFTEFGSYTVGESGAAFYNIIGAKQQNDREKWYMIDSSFMTTLPDSWSINKKFVMLAINRWSDPYERVLLGGLTCDSDDYYNSEQHSNAIFLPRLTKEEPLFVGFFNTGAYQESVGGYGGIQHCLLPAPKHVVVDRDEDGEVRTKLFAKEQSYKSMMKILGY